MIDASPRFFEYVMTLPGMTSYLASNLDASTWKTKTFFWSCVPKQQYMARLKATAFPTAPPTFTKMSAKKLLPPQWNMEDIATLQKLRKKINVRYVIFPCILEDARQSCAKKNVKPDKHLILFAYNKSKKLLELWDDMFGFAQVDFQYDSLIAEIYDFLKSIMDAIGYQILNVEFPIPDEKKYKALVNILDQAGYENSFKEAYSAFLSNYLRKRCEEMTRLRSKTRKIENVNEQNLYFKENTKTVKEVAKAVVPAQNSGITKFLATYDTLNTYTSLFRLKSPLPPRTNSDPLHESCPDLQMRDIRSMECVPILEDIKIPVEYMSEKQYFNAHPFIQYTYMALYFTHKFPNLAMMIPKNDLPYYWAIRWEYNSTLKERNRWVLSEPPMFQKFMKTALANPAIRFISMFVGIKNRVKRGHANTIIIDKVYKTVTRFEPNVGDPNLDRKYNSGMYLDNELKNLFKPFKLRVIPRDEACPLGLHRIEYHERTGNTIELGGNCALWSIYMMDLRLTYPDVPTDTLFNHAVHEIKKTGSFKHFVTGYIDSMLKSARQFRGHYARQRKERKMQKQNEKAS